jgi:hypothetical protein
MTLRARFGASIIAIAALATSAASANTITFSGLTDPTGTPLPLVPPYTEAGFRVSPVVGSFFEDQQVGNPTPSVFARGPAGNPATQPNLLDVAMTSGGGAFNFVSVDLDAIGGQANFIFSAFRNGVLQFLVSGVVPSGGGFITFTGPTPIIDDLRIGVSTTMAPRSMWTISSLIRCPAPSLVQGYPV